MTRSHRVFMRVVLAAVLVAGWVEANPATAQDATELDRQILAVESNPDCSECESNLERALNALKEANAEAAHLRERLSTSNGLLEDCRESRSRCRAGYARTRLALGYCRSRLGKCSENIVRCRARVEHCSDALGECRYELEECKGGQCCDPTLQPGVGGNPICFEGTTCCNDGTWRCNQADGSPSCPGPVGDVCDEPSSCCDPTQEPGTHGNPYCFEGATCCGDGMWKCNAGDLSSTCEQVGFVCRDCCDERDRAPRASREPPVAATEAGRATRAMAARRAIWLATFASRSPAATRRPARRPAVWSMASARRSVTRTRPATVATSAPVVRGVCRSARSSLASSPRVELAPAGDSLNRCAGPVRAARFGSRDGRSRQARARDRAPSARRLRLHRIRSPRCRAGGVES
jgi:hypothetical protein